MHFGDFVAKKLAEIQKLSFQVVPTVHRVLKNTTSGTETNKHFETIEPLAASDASG